MENEYFLNAGISPPVLSEQAMNSWNSFPLAQELSHQTSFCLLTPKWDRQFDHFTQFESPLSTIVPSPAPASNHSSYSKALNSPPKPQCGPILDQFTKENSPNLADSPAMNLILPADPEFVERAVKFSCFGNRSFNGRRNDFDFNNNELPLSSGAAIMGNDSRLHRVWSSPTLKQAGFSREKKDSYQSQMEYKKLAKLRSAGVSSKDSSSVSDQVLSGETVSKTPSEVDTKKRKAVDARKAKEDAPAEADNAHKGDEGDDHKNEKRSRGNGGVDGKGETKDGGLTSGDGPNQQDKNNKKPPEPPKDYIHVRARRGQATDSHSLAERVRREKISERMKLLQDLVPGCNKVTGKALMLDEIINYVKSLQHKVEFLSMKLASVNTRLESNMDSFASKDIMQPDCSFVRSLYSVESSVPVLYGHHQPKQSPPAHAVASASQCPVDSVGVDTTSYQNLQVQLTPLNGFPEGLPQFHGFFEDDLNSVVHAHFSQDFEREAAFHSACIPVPRTSSHFKLEH